MSVYICTHEKQLLAKLAKLAKGMANVYSHLYMCMCTPIKLIQCNTNDYMHNKPSIMWQARLIILVPRLC